MIAKLLEYLAEAEVAGIVMGARVPIALTSRADKPLSRMVSCAIALLVARRQASISDLDRKTADGSNDSRHQRRFLQRQIRGLCSCAVRN